MTTLFRRALPALVALSIISAAQAQEQPKQTIVGRVSMASVDAVNKVLTDLGVPAAGNSAFDLRTTLESAPFLGTGSIATDKPVGVTIVVGDPHRLFPFQDSIVASIPIAAGKAAPADLKANGGTALEGTTDSFNIAGTTIRRTADYLHAKASAGTYGLSAMTDANFAADYKDLTNLFVLSANFDVFRQSAPDAYKELAKQITSLPRMVGISTPDDTKPVESALDKIDKFTLALGQDDANLHLKSWLSPTPLSMKAKEALRPAFPAGMIFRMHVVYPTPESAAYVEKQLAALPEDSFAMGTPPVYHERIKALVLKAASLNSRTDAVSMAFAMKEGKPVFYVVDQFGADVDAVKEISDLAHEAVGLAGESSGTKVNLEGATYTAGNTKVQRLTLTPEAPAGGAAPAAGEKIVIDEIQTGRTLYLTFSNNADTKVVADLAAAGMDGKSTVLCTGALDLPAMLSAAIDVGGMPGTTPDMLQKLKTAWAGQGITWTVQSSDQNFLYTDIQVPKQVIRDLVKMSMQGSAQPAQPVTPGMP